MMMIMTMAVLEVASGDGVVVGGGVGAGAEAGVGAGAGIGAVLEDQETGQTLRYQVGF